MCWIAVVHRKHPHECSKARFLFMGLKGGWCSVSNILEDAGTYVLPFYNEEYTIAKVILSGI